MRKFSHHIIPIAVNCYGGHAITRKGGLAQFADISDETLGPARPSRSRCMEVSRAIARHFTDHDERVALVASSSWSHAFLTDALWHIRPDTEADERLYRLMVEDRFDELAEVSSREVVASGQHEMLNWFCLLGAVQELGLQWCWSTMVATDVFNSNKPFRIYS